MRNSSILKWANNKNSEKSNNDGENNNSKSSKKEKEDKKKWIHQPDTLVSGHVVYLVKFLGSTEVDQPKGIEVVKQGIQKLKFSQQLRKSDGQPAKPPKVELTISVDGVTIQEPKTKNLLHRYPLHRISYCADDKAEKRFFSFIAREGENNGSNSDDNNSKTEHTCFVFVSDKLAEEITLTIGQAFELAYKKFLDTSGKEMEAKKAMMTMQKKVQMLEEENKVLKTRLREVAAIKGMQDVQQYMQKNDITDITEVKTKQQQQQQVTTNGNSNSEDNTDKPAATTTATRPAPQPPTATTPTLTKAADELICLDLDHNFGVSSSANDLTLDDLNDDDFNPRSEDDDAVNNLPPPTQAAPTLSTSSSSNIIVPPPPTPNNSAVNIFAPQEDPFGGDPFGMSVFDAKKASNAGGPFAVSVGGGVDAGGLFADLDPLKK